MCDLNKRGSWVDCDFRLCFVTLLSHLDRDERGLWFVGSATWAGPHPRVSVSVTIWL